MGWLNKWVTLTDPHTHETKHPTSYIQHFAEGRGCRNSVRKILPPFRASKVASYASLARLKNRSRLDVTSSCGQERSLLWLEKEYSTDPYYALYGRRTATCQLAE